MDQRGMDGVSERKTTCVRMVSEAVVSAARRLM